MYTHAQKESFVELSETIGRKTGGLSVFPFTSPVRGKPEEPLAKIMVCVLCVFVCVFLCVFVCVYVYVFICC